MGLDATVMCRCWLDGTTRTPPPHAEHVGFDEEGQLCLTLPEERQDAHDAFYAWMEDCCPHPRMWLASEWISNWAGLRAFQAALDRIGWQHFPTLQAELPAANGGMMPAEASARALGELARFAELVASVRSAFLVDSGTGDELYDFVPQYEGIFVMSGSEQVNLGFDVNGFFVRSRGAPPRELFRALRVEQILLEPERTEAHEGGRVLLRDLDTGREFESRVAVPGGCIPWPDGRMQDDRGRVRSAYPRSFHVAQRALGVADFEQILGSLRRVFEASVATGNPVCWC
ncbi:MULTISPECIES: hypothetical protein [Sorangium]|uniref:Uncharacterized protein n=1 Tax=Sorangium cellulosum (strain So ce56) TaxID=448385 RepID=A9FZ39_SORC5|nr:hypothetical protein [Sorangium cellulosum]CAN98707.1 hypothetical protein predicted by Glimmer/Critica [Sorangium cellulosum So ce56]